MKSKTYKITLVIEAAIAALIAFCLAFFGPLSLNDMTYGEFDMRFLNSALHIRQS